MIELQKEKGSVIEKLIVFMFIFVFFILFMLYVKDKLKLECWGFCDFECYDNIFDIVYMFFSYFKNKS